MGNLNNIQLKRALSAKSESELEKITTALDVVWTLIDDVDGQHEVNNIMKQIDVALRTEKSSEKRGN